MRTSKHVVVILGSCLMLLIGCTSATGDAPAQVAKDWYVAVNTMEQLEADGLVCLEQRDQFRREMANGSLFLLAGEALLGADIDIEFDVDDVSFTTVENNGETAIVEAKGEMRGAVAGQIHSEEVNERWLMKQENGEWKWCGRSRSLVAETKPTTEAEPVIEAEPVTEAEPVIEAEVEEVVVEAGSPWKFYPIFVSKNPASKNGWSSLLVFFEIENTADHAQRFYDYYSYHPGQTAVNNIAPESIIIETSDGFSYPMKVGNIGASMALDGGLIPAGYRMRIDQDGSTDETLNFNYLEFEVPSGSSGYEIVFPDGERISLADTPTGQVQRIGEYDGPDDIIDDYLQHHQPNILQGEFGNFGEFYPVSQDGEMMVRGVIDRSPYSITIRMLFHNKNVGQDTIFESPMLFGDDGVIYRQSNLPRGTFAVGPDTTKEEDVIFELLGSGSLYALIDSTQNPIWIDLQSENTMTAAEAAQVSVEKIVVMPGDPTVTNQYISFPYTITSNNIDPHDIFIGFQFKYYCVGQNYESTGITWMEFSGMTERNEETFTLLPGETAERTDTADYFGGYSIQSQLESCGEIENVEVVDMLIEMDGKRLRYPR